MALIVFSGWYQCRLATDPDASDDPRGMFGSTRALPGEPDLDHRICLGGWTPRAGVTYQDGPVHVHTVSPPSGPLRSLVGAPLRFAEDSRFHGRDGLIAFSAQGEPIVPFEIGIFDCNSGAWFSRHHKDKETGGTPCPDLLDWDDCNVSALPRPVAAVDADGFLRELEGRQQTLRATLASADRTSARYAAARIRLERQPTVDSILYRRKGLFYRFAMTSPIVGSAPDGMNAPWAVQLWFHIWDGDALMGYLAGSISID